MINATVKLRVCLTEMCAMENSKGKGERRECPGRGGGGGVAGVTCSAVSEGRIWEESKEVPLTCGRLSIKVF